MTPRFPQLHPGGGGRNRGRRRGHRRRLPHLRALSRRHPAMLGAQQRRPARRPRHHRVCLSKTSASQRNHHCHRGNGRRLPHLRAPWERYRALLGAERPRPARQRDRHPSNVPNPTPVEVFGITTAVAVSLAASTPAPSSRTYRTLLGDNGRGAVGDGTPVAPHSPAGPPQSRRTSSGLPPPSPSNPASSTPARSSRTAPCNAGAGTTSGSSETRAPLMLRPPRDRPRHHPAASPWRRAYLCAPSRRHCDCWGTTTSAKTAREPETHLRPPTPTVTGIASATAVTSGAEHGCALLPGGTVQCWGRGLFGRLGDGTATGADAFTPVTVVGWA